jgi:hypothetical protein
LAASRAAGSAHAHFGQQGATFAIRIGPAQLLGCCGLRRPQLLEEGKQLFDEPLLLARLGFLADLQRLGFEQPLAQRVVRVARGGTGLGAAGGNR